MEPGGGRAAISELVLFDNAAPNPPLGMDDSRLLVAVTNDARALARVKALSRAEWGAEKIHVGRHAAYVWCANGILESKAAVALLKGLDDTATTRNWGTLNKIHALLGKAA